MAAEVKIFTTSWCGYCSSALRLLRDKGVAFEQIDANDRHTRRWLREVTGRSTVPQVFIDGVPVGGYTDLLALDERGELDRMLAGGASQGSSASG